MLLTVLLPSRNRKDRVTPLVAFLVANWPQEARDLYEIVVLDNASDDGTAEAVKAIGSDRVRVITNPVLLPTSEQNVVNGLQYARGEFIWFLGDDDLPRLETIGHMLNLLCADAADLFVFNFRVMDGDGKLASVAQIRGADGDCDTNLPALIRRIGLINVLSGWSIIVARRSMLDAAVAEAIMARSMIYSHCFWFLTCFAQARVRFVAQPLVSYRVFHSTGGWEKYTEERGVSYLHAWHLGVIKLYRYALEAGLLTPHDIGSIYEYRHDATRYRGIDEIALKLIEQADVYVKTRIPRNLLTEVEFTEAFDFLVLVDLSIQDALFRIRDMYNLLWEKPDLGRFNQVRYHAARGRAIEHLEWRKSDLFEPYFVDFYFAYSVYRVEQRWIAVRADAGHLNDSVFSQLDPRALPPRVLVEPTLEAIRSAIRQAPPVTEPVGQKPSMDLSAAPQAQNDLSHVLGLLEHRTQQLSEVYNSTFWMLTLPLRRTVILARRVIRRLRHLAR